MKNKYYIYILEKYLIVPKKGNVKKIVSKQVKKDKQQNKGGMLPFKVPSWMTWDRSKKSQSSNAETQPETQRSNIVINLDVSKILSDQFTLQKSIELSTDIIEFIYTIMSEHEFTEVEYMHTNKYIDIQSDSSSNPLVLESNKIYSQKSLADMKDKKDKLVPNKYTFATYDILPGGVGDTRDEIGARKYKFPTNLKFIILGKEIPEAKLIKINEKKESFEKELINKYTKVTTDTINQIEIDCDIELLDNDYTFNIWQKLEQLRILNDLKDKDLKDLKKRKSKNTYYIDTLLSSSILYVLQEGCIQLSNKVLNEEIESIIYVRSSLMKAFPKNKFWSNRDNIMPGTDVKTIDTDANDLKTFAITKTKYEDHGMLDIHINEIVFPKKLIFKLTPVGKNTELASDKLQKFAKIISDNIKKRLDKYFNSLSIDDLQKKISDKKETLNKEVLELTTYLNERISSAYKWGWLVKTSLNEMRIIIKELKKCEAQPGEAQPGEALLGEALGGKKHSKREILGKVMIIYKIKGDRKEYVRHKGKLITIKDYKALIKQKVKPKKKST
jgi:hypothetical protein